MKKSFFEKRKRLFPYLETPTFDSPLETNRLKFDIEFLPAAAKFMVEIGAKPKDKVYYNITRSRVDQNPKLFKKLSDVLWEFRTNYTGIQYRLLAFWDRRIENRPLVLITHGFIKKTSKVPSAELDRAHGIRKHYLQN